MKCQACGNEGEGDKAFIQVQVFGAASMAGIIQSHATEDEGGARQHVELFACSRCGTVRLEKGRIAAAKTNSGPKYSVKGMT